jgi:hypothetical protein
VADWVTISSLATAGGTLVLAMATFASVRSANRSARVAERSLMLGLRPVLVPSRPEDPAELVTFLDRRFSLPGGTAHVEDVDGRIYMAFPLRNVGSGLAILHGWHLTPRAVKPTEEHPDPAEFRMLARDLYVAPGDTGYWQGAIREPDDPLGVDMREAISEERRIIVDVLYGDHEGGQRTISRFAMSPSEDDGWIVTVVRHWSLDGIDPRHAEPGG